MAIEIVFLGHSVTCACTRAGKEGPAIVLAFTWAPCMLGRERFCFFPVFPAIHSAFKAVKSWEGPLLHPKLPELTLAQFVKSSKSSQARKGLREDGVSVEGPSAGQLGNSM